MGRIAHTKRNLMNTKFSMVTVACMFESFNETSSKWSIVKRKFLWLFCLSSIVVSNPSDRRRGHAFHPIIPKFKMNASSLLESTNVTEFSLLVRNPSAASAITMDSQWAVGSAAVFCGQWEAAIVLKWGGLRSGALRTHLITWVMGESRWGSAR